MFTCLLRVISASCRTTTWSSSKRLVGYSYRQKRSMSPAQISSALAPFYFSVHPDLFVKHPRERVVNENSLKLLNAFLGSGENHSGKSGSLVLPFYLRNDDGPGLTAVEVTLRTRDIRKAVKAILQSCQLSTDYVDNLAATAPPSVDDELRRQWDARGARGVPYDAEFGERIRYEASPYMDVDDAAPDEEVRYTTEVTLVRWLHASVDRARDRARASEKILAEVEILRRELITALGLSDIIWGCDWSAIHQRGILLSLKALHRHHPEVAHHLKDVKVIFGSESGLTLKGDLVLNNGEVRSIWLKMISRINNHRQTLSRVPAIELAVSRSLRDIQIVHRRFHPTILAEDYEINLRQLVTSIGDYQGRVGFPRHWPEKLSHLQLVVESAAGPLTLSPTGQLITPSSCPASLLIRFIDEKMEEAVKLLNVYEEDCVLEAELERTMRSVLKVKSLQKDNHVSPQQMISFCRRVLDPRLSHLVNVWKDGYVYVSTYYAISDDGTMYVPWNFK